MQMSGATLSWTEADEVSIFNENVFNDEYVFQGKTGDTNGTLQDKQPYTSQAEALKNKAVLGVFPYNPETAINPETSVLSVSMPQYQTYASKSFGPGANTMVACAEGSSELTFRNACGFLVIKLYGAGSVKQITLQGNNDERISGRAYITASKEAAPTVSLPQTSMKEVTIKCAAGVQLGATEAEATEFWFTLPPVTFQKGITIKAIDILGGEFTKTTTKSVTVSLNRVQPMKASEAQFTGGTTIPESTTSAKWEISAARAAEAESSWVNSNRFYAHAGTSPTLSYVSTTAGSGTEPKRLVQDNKVGVGNFNTGDCLLFTLPCTNVKAGSAIDFMLTIEASSAAAPKYFLVEYLDGGEWKSVENELRTASEDPSLKYSFYVKYFSSAHYTTFAQTYITTQDNNSGQVQLRCRVVGKYNGAGGTLSPSPSACIMFSKSYYRSCYINVSQGQAARDEKNVLVVGNSFTYYYGTAFMLKEIARSQGHQINLNATMKGSQYFSNHMALEMSQEEIRQGGYDYAILQDQSGQHAKYYRDTVGFSSVLDDTKSIIDQIKAKSPKVQPILENTWSFLGSSNYEGYGSFELFDKCLQGGCALICDKLDCWESPIGIAFEKARAAGITDLYHTDNKHPNRNGSYLKACVNYLLIYGEPFNSIPNDCLVSAATAAKLRAIAEEVVLGKADRYKDVDSSDITPGDMGGGGFDPGDIVYGEQGIRTAEQLLSFAALVNSDGDISSYKDENGNVLLLEDIDLKNVTWTPIGSTVSVPYKDAPAPSHPFTGVFDGDGHTISNLNIPVTTNQVNVQGLFGAVMNATVRDLHLENVTMDYTATGISTNHITIGSLCAFAYNSKFENCTASVSYTGKATSTAARNVAIGGLIGYISCQSADYAASVVNCSTSGSITNVIQLKYSNTNTASIGGVIGIAQLTGKTILIKGCTNNTIVNVSSHRAAGIISSGMTCQIEDCVNNANITCVAASGLPSGSVSGCRVGGVMAYNSTTTENPSWAKNCSNYGQIASLTAESAVGGVIGLMRTYHVEGCRNYGNVVCPVEGTARRGLLIGAVTNATVNSTVSNCWLKGNIATRINMSDAVTADAGNYLDKNIGITIADDAQVPTWNAENVHLIE